MCDMPISVWKEMTKDCKYDKEGRLIININATDFGEDHVDMILKKFEDFNVRHKQINS